MIFLTFRNGYHETKFIPLAYNHNTKGSEKLFMDRGFEGI